MKKLIYGGLFLALVGIIFVACKKEITAQSDMTNTLQDCDKKNVKNEDVEKINWPFSIGITFEPIRIHRATTFRPRDGKNCGCNECFGFCNIRAIGDGNDDESVIGVELINAEFAIVYFLDKKPKNFETEFGIDEPVNVKFKNGNTITFNVGEYNAIYEEGVYKDDFENEYNYFGKVKVKYSK